jgi:hypothetical protein
LVTLTALLGVGMLVTAATSVEAVTFGYEVNSVQSSNADQIFTFDPISLQLSVAQDATVDLTVDGATFNDAAFDFTATKDGLTTITTIAGRPHSVTVFDGGYSFFENGTGDLILGVTFADAVFVARNTGFDAGLFQSDDGADLVQFVYGPAMDALAGQQAPPEGFSFAIGNADPVFGTDIADQLEGFTANSSFVAHGGVIPEPGTMFLVTLGVLATFIVRGRQGQ